MTQEIVLWLLHVSAFFQTCFVVLWASLPWWREWIGRALMVKSIAIALYLDFVVVHLHLPDYPAQDEAAAVLFAFITLGIASQFVALAHEVRRASRSASGRVRGTEKDTRA